MKFTSIGFLFVLLFLLTAMLTGSTMYSINTFLEENDTAVNIYNISERALTWNDSLLSNERVLLYENNSNLEEVKTNRINRVIISGVNFLGTTMFEMAKFSLEFGYENPEYDFAYMINVVKFILLIMVLLAFAPVIIYILLLLYLVCETIATLIHKSRKRRRMMKQRAEAVSHLRKRKGKK